MKISKNIRREVEVAGVDYIVWIGPKGMLFKEKRKRLGKLLSWEQIKVAADAGVEAKALDGEADGADAGDGADAADAGGDKA